jgi:hypothetical protein
VAFLQVHAGDWHELPRRKNIRFRCCDCDLVHVFDFTVSKKGRISFRAFRDNRQTGQFRRYRKKERT